MLAHFPRRSIVRHSGRTAKKVKDVVRQSLEYQAQNSKAIDAAVAQT